MQLTKTPSHHRVIFGNVRCGSGHVTRHVYIVLQCGSENELGDHGMS